MPCCLATSVLTKNQKTAGSVYYSDLGTCYHNLFKFVVFYLFGAEIPLCYRYPTNGKPKLRRGSVHDETSGSRWRLHAYWSDRNLLCNRAWDARGACSPFPLLARDGKNSRQEIQHGEIVLLIKDDLVLKASIFVKAEGNSRIFRRRDTIKLS